MRWPWKRRKSSDMFVASWSGRTLTYVRARMGQDDTREVLQFGAEYQGEESLEAFIRRLLDLGLDGHGVQVMLRPEQYQLLQIEAPAVAPEEVRAAVRWQIRDMVNLPLDDITLDVMRVGGGKVGTPGQLFVVVVDTATVREMLRLGEALKWDVPVIDIQETAQRNLQTALARRDGRLERANAALMVVNEHQALLTISADEELYYSRRIDLGAGFLDKPWGQTVGAAAGAQQDVRAEEPQLMPTLTRQAADADHELSQRFVVEVQRSLDVWDRAWSNLPLDGLWVEAGARTAEMATWLSQELGFGVKAMEVDALFPGFDAGMAQDRHLCMPLLGALLRSGERKP